MINFSLPYKIIDMHTHMGQEYCLYSPDSDADGMIRHMDNVGVEMVISSPIGDMIRDGDERQQIADAMKRYPDRIRGYYHINPVIGYTKEEIQRAFEENPGYVGLKVLPDYHRTNLTDDAYRPALELADENGWIFLSHTWGVSMNGESCNSADKVAGVLDRYHNLKFLMGHSCQGQVDLAIDIAENYQNAYLDLCDTVRLNGVLEKMVNRVGAERITFGTDVPLQGFCFHLGCVLGARISEEDKKKILRDNALRILNTTGRF